MLLFSDLSSILIHKKYSSNVQIYPDYPVNPVKTFKHLVYRTRFIFIDLLYLPALMR